MGARETTAARPEAEEWTPVGDPSAGRLPDFVVIGAMKSGTTTLFECLARDPRLFLCTPKEPQFFSRNHAWKRGFGWYHSLFAPARPEQLCGEASTCYSRWPCFGDVPARLRRFVPGVKLIYLMRHPVQRAYSHYAHLMEERYVCGEPLLSFEAALETIPEIAAASRYLEQIERFLVHFPRDRMHFMTLDSFQRSRSRELEQLQAFLELPVVELCRAGPERVNPSGTHLGKVRWRRTVERIRHLPGIGQAVSLVPRSVRPRLRRWALGLRWDRWTQRKAVEDLRRRLTPLAPRTRAELLERFREPNRELGAFLGVDLSDWDR